MKNWIPRNWEYLLAGLIAIYLVINNFSRLSPTIVPELSSSTIQLGKYLEVLHDIPTREINDYSKYAYVQYATDIEYLTLAVINLIAIRRSGSKVHNLIVLYSDEILKRTHDFETVASKAEENGIFLQPVALLKAEEIEYGSGWHLSFTKLHVFHLGNFDRVVFFDADSMIVDVDTEQMVNHPGNMDELFEISPDIDIALPQAYWLNKYTSGELKAPPRSRDNSTTRINFIEHKFDNRKTFFASHVMVINPSKKLFHEIWKYVYSPEEWKTLYPERLIEIEDYDMEVINKFIDDRLREQIESEVEIENPLKVAILPHNKYGVLTGEFKEMYHGRFLAEAQELPFTNGRNNDGWDAKKVLSETKLLHFSDSPVPKPWESYPLTNIAQYTLARIYCSKDAKDTKKFNAEFPTYKPRITDDCDAVMVWDWIREEFERYRQHIYT
ncbi:glucose N-acetyltransferase 1 [[Candida] anglica]|uniref:Glucose N-acetyltransferase 1 n=1 Tax=[Candida] anglica TaxID=148631 RepID=A0ABP0EDU2_9ASCO